MPIDHVLIAVDDAAATAAALWQRHGLAAIEGGVHPGWGTGNWIVPLGASYLELVVVVNPLAAADHPFGRRVADALDAGGGPYAWCVEPASFEATAARLGLTPQEGSRRRPDGSRLAWRTAGLEVALADPSRPFFIEWLVEADAHPGRSTAGHRRVATLGRLEVSGDEPVVRSWLGDERPAVVLRAGSPMIAAVVLDTPDGELVLDADEWR